MLLPITSKNVLESISTRLNTIYRHSKSVFMRRASRLSNLDDHKFVNVSILRDFGQLCWLSSWKASCPKLWGQKPLLGSHFMVKSSNIRFYRYEFLLVVICTRGRTLHRFLDIGYPSLGQKSLYFAYLLAFHPRRMGFPGRISVCYCMEVSEWLGTKWYRNIAENFNWLSRAHERYRQTTHHRRICDSKYPNVT